MPGLYPDWRTGGESLGWGTKDAPNARLQSIVFCRNGTTTRVLVVSESSVAGEPGGKLPEGPQYAALNASLACRRTG